MFRMRGKVVGEGGKEVSAYLPSSMVEEAARSPLNHVLQHCEPSRHRPASLFFLETKSAQQHRHQHHRHLVVAARRFLLD